MTRNLDTLFIQFDASLKTTSPIARALPASPGAACGKVVFTAEDAKKRAESGEKVILVRLETSPEDIEGMKAAQGILTARGGMTSHAAVVARGMGKCCVSGCSAIIMDEENRKFTLAGKVFTENDYISLDGSTGNIYDGIIPTVDATISGYFERIMTLADKFRKLKVRTNADTPPTQREHANSARGVLPHRHIFFEGNRIDAIRKMICSDKSNKKRRSRNCFIQQGDFGDLKRLKLSCSYPGP